MKNSRLIVSPSGMFLEDNINPGSWVAECGIHCNITSMADPRIAEHILLCNKYGFYPEVIMWVEEIA
jgi:hypothetical protein